MSANFIANNSKLSRFDKFILVYNFQALNEVFNQGFGFKKSKIKIDTNIVGVWKIKKYH